MTALSPSPSPHRTTPQERLQGTQSDAEPDMHAGDVAQGLHGTPISLPRASGLLAAAMLAAVLFDRLVASQPLTQPLTPHTVTLVAYFWMAILAMYYGLFWRSARTRPVSWLLAAAVTALCVWLRLSAATMPYAANPEFQMLAVLMIPALLMLHLQVTVGAFDPYVPRRHAAAWLSGWLLQPFSALGYLGITLRTLADRVTRGSGRSTVRKVAIALLVVLPLLAMLVPLLTSADLIFAYALSRLIGHPHVGTFALHLVIVAALTAFAFSFLWNAQMRDARGAGDGTGGTGSAAGGVAEACDVKTSRKVARPLDPTVLAIVLAVVLCLYVAFCTVQFAFLFARQGLPDGYTYAEYAREGFWQLLLVTGINLTGFGIALTYARRTRTLEAMLAGLLAATGVMVASAALRLWQYILAYGLTWLRYASMTFIALVAVLVVLCLIRIRVHIPLIVIGTLLTVLWFVALGYSNPHAVITAYNLPHGM